MRNWLLYNYRSLRHQFSGTTAVDRTNVLETYPLEERPDDRKITVVHVARPVNYAIEAMESVQTHD